MHIDLQHKYNLLQNGKNNNENGMTTTPRTHQNEDIPKSNPEDPESKKDFKNESPEMSTKETKDTNREEFKTIERLWQEDRKNLDLLTKTIEDKENIIKKQDCEIQIIYQKIADFDKTLNNVQRDFERKFKALIGEIKKKEREIEGFEKKLKDEKFELESVISKNKNLGEELKIKKGIIEDLKENAVANLRNQRKFLLNMDEDEQRCENFFRNQIKLLEHEVSAYEDIFADKKKEYEENLKKKTMEIMELKKIIEDLKGRLENLEKKLKQNNEELKNIINVITDEKKDSEKISKELEKYGKLEEFKEISQKVMDFVKGKINNDRDSNETLKKQLFLVEREKENFELKIKEGNEKNKALKDLVNNLIADPHDMSKEIVSKRIGDAYNDDEYIKIKENVLFFIKNFCQNEANLNDNYEKLKEKYNDESQKNHDLKKLLNIITNDSNDNNFNNVENVAKIIDQCFNYNDKDDETKRFKDQVKNYLARGNLIEGEKCQNSEKIKKGRIIYLGINTENKKTENSQFQSNSINLNNIENEKSQKTSNNFQINPKINENFKNTNIKLERSALGTPNLKNPYLEEINVSQDKLTDDQIFQSRLSQAITIFHSKLLGENEPKDQNSQFNKQKSGNLANSADFYVINETQAELSRFNTNKKTAGNQINEYQNIDSNVRLPTFNYKEDEILSPNINGNKKDDLFIPDVTAEEYSQPIYNYFPIKNDINFVSFEKSDSTNVKELKFDDDKVTKDNNNEKENTLFPYKRYSKSINENYPQRGNLGPFDENSNEFKETLENKSRTNKNKINNKDNVKNEAHLQIKGKNQELQNEGLFTLSLNEEKSKWRTDEKKKLKSFESSEMLESKNLFNKNRRGTASLYDILKELKLSENVFKFVAVEKENLTKINKEIEEHFKNDVQDFIKKIKNVY